jgi:acyl carrier protein
MKRDELLDFVRKQLAVILEMEPDQITERSDLADIDADSIDLIEVVNAVEREYGVQIEEQELYDILTVGEFLDVVEVEIARKS